MRRYYSIAAIAWLLLSTFALASCMPQSPSPTPEVTPTLPTPAQSASGDASNRAIMPTQPAAQEASTPMAAPKPNSFVETFDGSPTQPQPWRPANWDITIHSRDIATWETLEPMTAMHGGDCGPPPATHEISAYEDSVFLCRDHLMTAIMAEGYGVIYLTPNQLVDFSNDEAIISWDMSTARTSGRDWVDLWITPYQDNLQLPLEDWLPDLNGEPRNAIHIRMDLANGDTMFTTSIINDFEIIDIPGQNLAVGYESFLTPDAKRRDKFELRVSRTHISFGMPDYNFFWIDSAIPKLDWDKAIVQLGHHSYNPAKDAGCPINQTTQTGCAPTTWHWDNISIHPAAPFTILRADRRTADATGGQVNFSAPAPANAHLRFAGIGGQLQLSYDAGRTWQPAVQQAQEKSAEEHFSSYWTPVPPGAQTIQFRGSDWWGGPWMARDISIWALDPASSVSSK